MARRTTLFVAGFGPDLRARDLAYEFERYGRLVRCDIPAPKSASAKVGYAFVEFEDDRDAEDAYQDMHGRRVDGYQLTVQWAKNAPSSNWRYERRRSPSPPRRGYGGGSRGGDYRDSRDYGSRGGDSRRGGPPPAEHHRGGERDRSRSRSRSPVRGGGGGDASSSRRDRSPSPRRQASPPPLRGEDREDERDHRVHDDDDLSAAAPHSAAEESRYRDNEDADAPAANGAQD